MAWCRRCIQLTKGRNPENIMIPAELAEPIYKWMKAQYWPKSRIAKAVGIRNTYFSNSRRLSMRGVHFWKLLNLALEVELERCGPPKNGGAHLYESWSVEPEPLGEILRVWEARWLASQGYVEGVNESIGYGAMEFLKDKTGISHKTIRSIVNSQRRHVVLSYADLLLSAIQQSELLSTGEIKVVLNPEWLPTKYVRYLRSLGLT